MMQFKIIMKTMTSGIPWEYDFVRPSIEMGKLYASEQTKKCAKIPWFMGLTLFVRNDTQAPYELVGEFIPRQETTVQFYEAKFSQAIERT